MLYINEDDPVFHHGLTNSLLNTMTLGVIDERDPKFAELQFANFVDAYKILVMKLQRGWWAGNSGPPLFYSSDPKYATASPELREILSFDVFGKERMSPAEWRTWFQRQPTWPVLRNAILAYDTVLEARRDSYNLQLARADLEFMVMWFQAFVRRYPSPHRQLRELVSSYYPRHEVEREYELHLAVLKRFTILTSTPKVREKEKKEKEQSLDKTDTIDQASGGSYNSEANSEANNGANSGAFGVVALLGVGAAAFLLFR